MKAKKIISGLMLCVLSSNVIAQSQEPPPPPREPGERSQERRENIEAMKIAFITQKLNLSPSEAQQFWPVYNEYTNKLEDLRKKHKQERREAKQNATERSDKEIEQEVDGEIIFRQKELDIQKEYHAKFKSVLPIKKVAKLYVAEEQFKMVLLDKLKDRERDRKQSAR